MSTSDEELIAQFAALSSYDENNTNEVTILPNEVKNWDWNNCLLMRVMASRVVFEATFNSAIRKTWPLHPDTCVEGLGSNYFLVEFKVQEEMLKVMARNNWLCNRDFVITRPACGSVDLEKPNIEEFECWVEIHGIPPESLDRKGLERVMARIGKPITEIKSFFYGGRRVYKQKVMVDLKEPLTTKIPVKHPQLGTKWGYVVFDNIANVCMFCARIGHDQSACPAKLKLKLMQKAGTHKERLGDKPIPEVVVGKWINDRAYVPRNEETPCGKTREVDEANKKEKETVSNQNIEGTSQERGIKRPINLNNMENRMITIGGNHDNEEGEELHLNCKRAKEANPNSPSRCQ